MKGWTVTTSASTSTTGREIYFMDAKHPNHIKTEKILEVFGSPKSAMMMSASAELYRAQQRLKRRGGRPPSSEAVEFVLELPKGLRPTEKEWRAIVADVMKEVAETCDIADVAKLSQTTRAVVHQQDQTITRDKKTGRITGSGDHCHLMIGKFTPKALYLRNLQRKTCTNAVKAAFSKATLLHCKFDWEEYASREGIAITTKNTYSKRSNKWVVDAKRANGVLKRNELMVIDKLNFFDKVVNKFLNQAEKWKVAFDKGDKKEMDRQHNRMDKSTKEIGSEIDSIPMEDKSFMDKVNEMTAVINDKSGKTEANQLSTRPTNAPKMG
jgi:hypothetical protein